MDDREFLEQLADDLDLAPLNQHGNLEIARELASEISYRLREIASRIAEQQVQE